MEKLLEFAKRFTDENQFGKIIKIKRQYYLVSDEIDEVLKKINEQAFYAGVFLGEEGKEFIPSFNFLDILSESSNKKIVVNSKGEWMFLCGKDVFSESIIKSESIMKRGDFVFVQNKENECLGYGMIVDKGSVFVKNVMDKGDYLRREMRK